MKKQELIEAVGELNLVDTAFEADGVSYIDTAVSLTRVYDLIDQLEEPVKVVIPQFVAEAFEKAKGDNWFASPLVTAMYKSSDEVGYWLEVPSNEKLLLRAWLDDSYEIEKEKLYYVLDKNNHTMLYRLFDYSITQAKSEYAVDPTRINFNLNEYELTEQEIRNYDARFMAFAVEVAE